MKEAHFRSVWKDCGLPFPLSTVRTSSENAKITPTFVFADVGFDRNWVELGTVVKRVRTKKPKKSGFLPTFENGFGHKKVNVFKGLRAKSPLAHFFSLLNTIKRLKI